MDYVDDLLRTVTETRQRLLPVRDEDAARAPAPGKWSAKEIIGHLIDSASNNHQRFVRASSQPDLVFVGYDQNAWVSLQRYASAPWVELLDLWVLYNRHLARVMVAVPEVVRLLVHTRHNLDEMAWQPVPRAEATTLDYFMRDYVGHLRHHLRQIDALRLPGATAAP